MIKSYRHVIQFYFIYNRYNKKNVRITLNELYTIDKLLTCSKTLKTI